MPSTPWRHRAGRGSTVSCTSRCADRPSGPRCVAGVVVRDGDSPPSPGESCGPGHRTYGRTAPVTSTPPPQPTPRRARPTPPYRHRRDDGQRSPRHRYARRSPRPASDATPSWGIRSHTEPRAAAASASRRARRPPPQSTVAAGVATTIASELGGPHRNSGIDGVEPATHPQRATHQPIQPVTVLLIRLGDQQLDERVEHRPVIGLIALARQPPSNSCTQS